MTDAKKLIPKFNSETEEAAWWQEHRVEMEAELRSRINRRDFFMIGLGAEHMHDKLKDPDS